MKKISYEYRRTYPSINLLLFTSYKPFKFTTVKPTVTTLTTVKPTVKQGLGTGIPKPNPLPNPFLDEKSQGQSQTQNQQLQNNFPIGSQSLGTSTSAVMPPRLVGPVGAGKKSRIRRQTKKRIKHRVTRKRNKGRKIKRYTKYHVVSRKPKSRRRKQ